MSLISLRCANCAKAGTPCVDVDARNAEQLIPRNSISQAKARIQWLEEIIAAKLPDIDLSAGPQVEFDATDSSAQPDHTDHSRMLNENNNTSHQNTRLAKRSHVSMTEEDNQESFNTEARSVALDLGRLSLNADSREKHYLGSSSGLIFSYLIGTPPGTADQISTFDPRDFVDNRTSRRTTLGPYHRILVSGLPTRENASKLIKIYLQHVHPNHPVLHIQSLLSVLDSLYMCCEMDATDELDHHGWPINIPAFAYNGEIDTAKSQPSIPISLPAAMFHCFMVFALAATVKLGGSQNEFASASFYRSVEAVALEALSDTTLPSLQGIYLLAAYATMTPAKINVWTLLYVCTAHCIDLGIHRQQDNLPLTSKITRSLLFYSVYSLDRMIATIQGRPLGIRDETFDVRLPTLDEMQAEIAGQDLPETYQTAIHDTAAYSLHRFRLDKLVSDIKTTFYFLPGQIDTTVWSTDYPNHQWKIQQALESWYAEIYAVEAGVVEPQRGNKRWQINLEQQYYAATVLLFQPSQVFRRPTDECFQQCFDAAISQIECYNTLYEELDMLHFDFSTIRSIFACGATIIYCFWTSKNLQKASQADKLPKTLRTCSMLLAVGAVWWPSVKKGRSSFARLVDLTLQKSNDLEKRETERSVKRRVQSSRSRTGQNVSSQMPAVQAGLPLPTPVADYPPHFENGLMNVPNSQYDLSGQPSDQSQAFDPVSFSSTNDRHMGTIAGYDLEDASPSYDLTAASSHLEPEIAAFLSDYFLDDPSWTFTDPGPSMSFHFGGV